MKNEQAYQVYQPILKEQGNVPGSVFPYEQQLFVQQEHL